jgi:hypothetical protein
MVFSIAQLWAERVLALETDPKQRIHSMFNTWLSRPATDEEIDAGIALLNNSSAPPDSQQAWTIYALALLNLKEGLYVR